MTLPLEFWHWMVLAVAVVITIACIVILMKMEKDMAQKLVVTTNKEQQENLLSYFERLEDMPLAELLLEAKEKLYSFNEERMVAQALANRLQAYRKQELNNVA